MATLVACSGCGVELFDDRKICPHCQTPVVPASAAQMRVASDDKERGFIQQIVKLEQTIVLLNTNNAYLKSENERLHSENTELRKQVSPPAPTNVERSGPGVVVEMPSATAAAPPPAPAAAAPPEPPAPAAPAQKKTL